MTTAINGGNPIRIRVPTALERAGDFSQTRDNNGALFNLIKDPNSTQPCTAANTAGCFAAGGVLGKIPTDRLYSTGLALLSRYPLPNVNQGSGQNYNYETPAPTVDNLTQQPSIRVDYQLSSKSPSDRQVLRPARTAAGHAGDDPGLQRRPQSVPLHHELRRDRELHAEQLDLPRRHLRLHPQPAGRRRIDRRDRHRRHSRQPIRRTG